MNLIKKIFLFISLSCVFHPARTQSIKLQKFYDNLKKYKPNAPWIMSEIIQLDFKEFIDAFTASIQLLADKKERRQYFDHSIKFTSTHKWPRAWWQCAVYEKYLENLYWNEQDSEFFLNVGTTNFTQLLEQEYIPVLLALKEMEFEEQHPLFLFYAFYTDCLTHVFASAIKQAHLAIEDKANFQNAYIKVIKLQKILEQKIKLLAEFTTSNADKTKFQNTYQPLITRNQEIIKLLQNEKAQVK